MVLVGRSLILGHAGEILDAHVVDPAGILIGKHGAAAVSPIEGGDERGVERDPPAVDRRDYAIEFEVLAPRRPLFDRAIGPRWYAVHAERVNPFGCARAM